MKTALSLTENQKSILQMVSKGHSFSETARMLGLTKQYIQQTFRTTESLVLGGLMDVAQANQIQLRKVDPVKGILWGHQPWLNTDAIITFVPGKGVRVWYWNQKPEDVKDRALLEDAKNYLLEEARHAGIQLSEDEKRSHPGKLAHILFSRMIPELAR